MLIEINALARGDPHTLPACEEKAHGCAANERVTMRRLARERSRVSCVEVWTRSPPESPRVVARGRDVRPDFVISPFAARSGNPGASDRSHEGRRAADTADGDTGDGAIPRERRRSRPMTAAGREWCSVGKRDPGGKEQLRPFLPVVSAPISSAVPR